MAALLRSGVPEEAAPRAEYAAELQAKLEQEVQQPSRTRHVLFRAKKPQGRAGVSGRAVLAGGAAAVAASLAVGAGLEHVVEQAASASSLQSTKRWPTPLVPASTASTWLFVTMFAELGDKAVRFATDAIVGYVIRNDGDGKAGTNEPVVAVSAACTHMGCIVQWQDSHHPFHCPFHR